MSEKKKTLRLKYQKIRDNIFCESGDKASIKLSKLHSVVIDSFNFHNVAGYWPIRSEMNCLPLMEKLYKKGFNLCLPITPKLGNPLLFRSWNLSNSLTKGKYNIMEPRQSSKLVKPDLLLIPLLAYDLSGNRLGYGGGYYDRTLEFLRSINSRTIAIGLGFKGQQCRKLPRDFYDSKLDAIFNEDGLTSFR